jgi:flagellin FlaB
MIKQFMKAMRNLHKDDRGMTGLETAIILIAFVTVAAVFGYAVLSAGLFSAERGKETVYAGLKAAQANLEISGSVIAMTTNNVSVEHIKITVKNAVAGSPIDMTPCDGTPTATNKTVISLVTPDSYLNNVQWTKEAIGAADTDNLLETGEQFEIDVDLNDLGDGKALTTPMGINTPFSFQVKPALGSTITVMRTLPPAIDLVMDLH